MSSIAAICVNLGRILLRTSTICGADLKFDPLEMTSNSESWISPQTLFDWYIVCHASPKNPNCGPQD